MPTTVAQLRNPGLPLSSNGKVDRQALALLLARETSSSTTYVAPSTPDQQRMVALWEGVLPSEAIGLFDDFFQMGGDSIRAIELVTTMRRDLGVELGLADLYALRTPDALLRHLEARGRAHASAPRPGSRPRPILPTAGSTSSSSPTRGALRRPSGAGILG